MQRSDVMLLELRLRSLARGMGVSLVILKGTHNTPHAQPVSFKFGSNSFTVNMDALEDLMPLVDDSADTREYWLNEYLAPFLERYANQ